MRGGQGLRGQGPEGTRPEGTGAGSEAGQPGLCKGDAARPAAVQPRAGSIPCRSSPGPRGIPGRLPWGQLLWSVPPESLGSHRGLLGKAPAAFAFGASRDGRWQRSRTRQPVKAEEDDRLYLLEIQTSVYNPELQHSEEGSGLFFFFKEDL